MILPLVYPIVTKLLIDANFFQNISEIEQLMHLYKSIYMLPIIAFVICIFIYIVPNKEKLFDVVKHFKVNIGNGDKKVEFAVDSNIEKLCVPERSIEDESNKNKEEIQTQLGILQETNEEDRKFQLENATLRRDISKLETERDDLRFFSAYSITNANCRKLLKKIMNSDKITTEEFYEILTKDYNKKIKNIYGKAKENYITNKINILLENLKYLNIIEYSEDGDYILLTFDGLSFVKGLERREV